MTTGERIKAARKAANMTQQELAEKLEIPYQSISQWERDLRNPKPQNLQKIAEALGCNSYWLQTGSGEMVSFHDLLSEFTQQGLTPAEVLALVKLEIKKREFIEFLDDAQEYRFSESERRIVAAHNKLNSSGQQKAVERVEELTEIPKYQREETPPADAQEPTEDK